MSRRLEPRDFEQVRRQWTTTYEPVSPKDLQAWRPDWTNGLAVLPYLGAARTMLSDQPDSLVTVRCTLNNPKLPLEGIAADLERVWTENLAEELDPCHAVVLSPSLVLYFAGLTKAKCYVTGRVIIETP